MKSDTIGKLAEALAAAQGEMKNAPLNKVNPHFKSKFADLSSIRDASIPALSKHGIAVTQTFESSETGTMLVTTLMHKSGEWITSACPIMADKGGPQPFGSATTYARRYGLGAIVGISADDDDDGNAGQEKAIWHGPLPKTALVTKIREVKNDLMACSDLDEYDACLGSYKAIVDQFALDMPTEWLGPLDAGTPWSDTFEAIREKIANPPPAPKTIDFVTADGKIVECATPTAYFKAFGDEILGGDRGCWELDENVATLEKFVAANPKKYQPLVDQLEGLLAQEVPPVMAG